MKAQRVRWREVRGGKLSATVYAGVLTEVGNQKVLVSNLSHGLRVFPKRSDSEYCPYGDPVEIDVSVEFLAAVRKVFLADQEFQSAVLQEFNQVILYHQQ